ncbi:MAG TPA: beta-ketoacyl-ACP synthase II [Thermoleophilaceae bacterium]
MSRTAVITGVGAVTPLGVGARTLHERWTAGNSGIEDGVGACSEFEPTDHLSTKEVRRSDRFTQLALVAAAEALEDAGWDDAPPYERDRVGSVIGTGIGGIGTLEKQHLTLQERGPEKVSPLAIPLLMANAASGVLAMRYGLEGQSFGTVSACAASSHSIGLSARLIAYGDADAVVTGGSESTLTPLATTAFRRMEATSPSGISRPFDARRDGFVMGEGAGVLVLEEESKARERGARILGRVRGYGATSDAHHLTAPEPHGQGAARAVERALEDAGVGPDDLLYVNAHGTSTPLNDRSETEALKSALGDERAHELPVSSTKSAIGHLLGAAGAVEAIATLLALRDRVAPPTLNYEEPDEGLDLDYVTDGAKPLPNGDTPAIGISNSFGFGGHNAVICLEAAQ